MHLSVSLRILGLLLMLFSSAMLVPLVVAVLQDDNTITGFLSALAITFLSGLTLWLPVRNSRHELRIRDGFLVTRPGPTQTAPGGLCWCCQLVAAKPSPMRGVHCIVQWAAVAESRRELA